MRDSRSATERRSPTIRSRCQMLRFGRVAEEEIVGLLQRVDDEHEGDLSSVAVMASGSVGAAFGLLNDPILRNQDELIQRMTALEPGDVEGAFALANDLADAKESLDTIFDVLQRLYRDALLLRNEAQDHIKMTYPHLQEGPIRDLAQRYGVDALLYRLNLLDETRRGVSQRHLPLQLSLERLVYALAARAGREGASTGIL